MAAARPVESTMSVKSDARQRPVDVLGRLERADLLARPLISLDERARSHRAVGFVGEEDDAGSEGARRDQAQLVHVDPIAEQALAAAQDDRVDEEAELVDQVVAQELVDEIRTAVDEELAARLRLQRRDLVGHIAREDRRVVPVGAFQRVGHDVLRDGVHLLGHLDVATAGRRPERRPDLPRPPAQQKRVRGHRLGPVVDLVLVGLDPKGPRVAPGPVLVEPGRLDDAVEGHEGSHDELHDRRLVGGIGRRATSA